MSIDRVTSNSPRITTQPPFTIAQGLTPVVDDRLQLLNRMFTILATQTGPIEQTSSKEWQAGGNNSSSRVYDTSTKGDHHPLGKVAISVTERNGKFSGALQLYRGDGTPPEVLNFQPAPFSSAHSATTHPDFAREIVKALMNKRFDEFSR